VSGDQIGADVERGLQQVPAVSVALSGDLAAAGEARRALEPLRQALDEALFGDIRLLVSELVADDFRAHEHDRAQPLELSARLEHDLLRVELTDDWGDPPDPEHRPEPGEPGWGLYLARLLTDRWGIDAASTGSRVWFEVKV
jgi:anti-sigma regulatory factor (Ser/Thr protein kinase)